MHTNHESSLLCSRLEKHSSIAHGIVSQTMAGQVDSGCACNGVSCGQKVIADLEVQNGTLQQSIVAGCGGE